MMEVVTELMISHEENNQEGNDTVVTIRIFYVNHKQISSAKVNSVQEACDKCSLVHISKFEILQTT